MDQSFLEAPVKMCWFLTDRVSFLCVPNLRDSSLLEFANCRKGFSHIFLDEVLSPGFCQDAFRSSIRYGCSERVSAAARVVRVMIPMRKTEGIGILVLVLGISRLGQFVNTPYEFHTRTTCVKQQSWRFYRNCRSTRVPISRNWAMETASALKT